MNKKLFNTQVEALTREHGLEIVEFYKRQGFNTGDYKGSSCKKDSDIARFYGVNNLGSFMNRSSNILTNHTLEQLKEMVNETKTTKNEVLVGKLKTAYEEVSCSEIKARIQTYLERNWRGFDNELVRIKQEDIQELYSRGSKGDIEILEGIDIKPLADLSVINGEDVFVLTTINTYLIKGHPLKDSPHLHLPNGTKYFGRVCDSIGIIKSIRKATPEEEELYYKHFPKYPVEGTPFLVRDSDTRWWLAYADGNGKYVGLDGIGSVPYAYSHELKISKGLLPK